MSEVDHLFNYFFGRDGDASRRDLLALDPDRAAKGAAERFPELGRAETTTAVRAIAALMRVSTTENARRREEASRRVSASIRSMHGVHLLALALNGVIFAVGCAFILCAIWLGWVGRLDAALVAGSVGVIDVAIGMLARPQRAVMDSAEDQLQIQMAYNSFTLCLDQVGMHYDWQSTKESLDLKDAVADLIHGAAAAAVADIERYAISQTGGKGDEPSN